MEDNPYLNAKVLDWWKDDETNQYFSIIELKGQWRVITCKVEDKK